MGSPLVYVSILNWNGYIDTIACIASVLKSEYDNYRIIVVDNASSDDSVRALRQRFPDIVLIENNHNSGFTGGNNIAIDYAINRGADYVWLLNNDTEVEPSTLSGIIDLAESNPSLGMVSPLIHYYEDKSRIQFGGATIDPVSMAVSFMSDEERKGKDLIFSPLMFLWGTALLVKTKLIRQIGMLDDFLFMYWEDTEFSLRASKAGYSAGLCCTQKIYHKTAINDFGKRGPHYYYYMIRNALLVAKKYLITEERRIFVHKKISDVLLSIADLYYMGEVSHAYAALMGIFHGLSGRGGKMNIGEMSLISKSGLYLAATHPYFVGNLVSCDYKSIAGQIRRKFKSSFHN